MRTSLKAIAVLTSVVLTSAGLAGCSSTSSTGSATPSASASTGCAAVEADYKSTVSAAYQMGLQAGQGNKEAAIATAQQAREAAQRLVTSLGQQAPTSYQTWLDSIATFESIVQNMPAGETQEQLSAQLAAANTPAVVQASTEISNAVKQKCPNVQLQAQ